MDLSRALKLYVPLAILLILIVVTETLVLNKTKLNSPSTAGAPKHAAQTSGAYIGWQTYCSTQVSACVKYPAGWQAVKGFPGAFEDSANTVYLSLLPGSSQDNEPNSAYINSVSPLNSNLDIVGYIVSNQPGYVVFASSYVQAKDLTPGVTRSIVDGNYAFPGPKGTVSLVATPGANAYASISTLAQAQAWFAGASGQLALKSLQSFYFE